MAPPTIVLLHGFTQTGRSWAPTIAALGERYRALAPDLRGHGDNAAARPVDFAAIAADVLALVDAPAAGTPAAGTPAAGTPAAGTPAAGTPAAGTPAAGTPAAGTPAAASPPRPFTLAGYSMGGRIALRLALDADPDRDRIERLVLVGASPGLRGEGERAARRAADETLAQELERDGVEPFARRWAQQPLFADQPPAVAAAAHAERLRNDPAGLAAALRGVGTGTMPSLWERLPQLAIPVTLVVGERDAKFRRIAEQMAQAIPRATVHVVAGAGHAVQLEDPQAVAALLA